MNKYMKLLDTMKFKKGVKKIYNSDIWKWFKANGDCIFTVIDSNGCATHHTYRHIEDFFVKHNLKNAYLDKNTGILVVDTYNNRYRSISDRYVVLNKKLRLE